MNTLAAGNPNHDTAVAANQTVSRNRFTRWVVFVASCIVIASCTVAVAGPLLRSATEVWAPAWKPRSPWPVFSQLGDFNADGTPDVATISFQTLIVRLGDGHGGFGAAAFKTIGPFSTPDAPTFTIADVNGDGALDVVTGYQAMRGDGNGTFEESPQFFQPTSGYTEDVSPLIADFTGDGIVDLALLCGSWMRVRPGLGGGVLDSAISSYLGSNGRYVAASDVNGDGRPDLAVTSHLSGGSTRVYLGAADGTFPTLTFAGAPGGPCSFTDLDGDGDVDLVSGSAVFLGDGAGHFSPSSDLPGPALSVADFDRDGIPDVVVPDASGVTLMHGDGSGLFMSGLRIATGPDPYEIQSGDIDGDGHIDMLVSTASGPALELVLNGPSGFYVRPSLSTGPTPVALARLDANGDGRDDLVVGCRGDRTVSLKLGVGDGTFVAGASTTLPAGLARIAVADLDGNGRPELIAASDTSASISVVPVLAGGVFGPRTDLPGAARPVGVTSADIDGDGRSEVLVAYRAPNALFVVESDGLGAFTSHIVGITGLEARDWTAIAAGDWSGDGIPDVALGVDNLSDSPQIRLARGDGAGGFDGSLGWAGSLTVTFPSRVRALAFDDLDGDGDADLAAVADGDSAGTHRTRVAVYRCQGGQVTWFWGANEGINAPIHPGVPLDLTLTDLTGDGRPEMLFSDDGNRLAYLENLGGTFTWPPVAIGAGDGPVAIAVGHFDGDELIDAAAADMREDRVTLLFHAATDLPTPVLASVMDARGEPGRITLRWRLTGGGSVTLQRSRDGAAWKSVAPLTANGFGEVEYVDRDVMAGHRHGYRLLLDGSPSGEVWVDVPPPSLALLGPVANPARGTLRVAFALPETRTARLELFDVSGRRVKSHDVAVLGQGEHVFAFGAVSPGLYVVRLAADGQARVARAVVLP